MTADFLVLGSGIAGIRFALEAAAHGEVLVVTKGRLDESNSAAAQGGIASVQSPEDSVAQHVADTLAAGAGLCHRDAVAGIVEESGAAIDWLIGLGARFTRTDGALDLHREGGHARARVVHATDATGVEVMRVLLDAARRHPRITIREETMAVALGVVPAGAGVRCTGAHLLDLRGARTAVGARRAVLLATGGAGRLFRYTTNPAVATGEGIALAWRAGAQVANLEFFQFHPTMLYRPGAPPFLVSEAVRGFGAELVDANGTPFMSAYHPMGALAPRDVVSRAIVAELARTGAPCVYLDLRRRDPGAVFAHFPTISAACAAGGIDMARDLVPVVPAAHYLCGGVATDLRGRTTIEGLYAAGEVACTGVHGANRLASNSLLEGLVFGRRAAQDAVRRDARAALVPDPEPGGVPGTTVARHELQRLMWEHVGIVRSDAGLAHAAHTLRAWDANAGAGTPATIAETETRMMLTTARLLVACARLRRESRGTHWNRDHPARDDARYGADTMLRPAARRGVSLAMAGGSTR